MDFENGAVLLFDKPLRWTSFDLVNKARKVIQKSINKKIKVGHAGTLDPLASGLLIVCTGKCTKQIESFQDLVKEYVADVNFGETTPSFDLETSVDKTWPYAHITAEKITEALQGFLGETKQTPPLFSAISVNGHRAYKFARRGEDIELEARTINIPKIELLEYNAPLARIRVQCSKGTYIRALARDLGLALESGAHLTGLCRTAIGNYLLKDAITIEDFEKNISFASKLI
jgi:tRNA pseudouridine55 synthase